MKKKRTARQKAIIKRRVFLTSCAAVLVAAIALIAFTTNDVGNVFWHNVGWKQREDLNYYDFTLNEANIIAYND